MSKYLFYNLIVAATILTTIFGCGLPSDKEVITESEEVLKEKHVVIETTMGTMVVKLYDDTPLHRDNFVKHVEAGYYEGTLFHRIIKDFMAQGGDPNSKGAAQGVQLGNGGPGYTIPAEFRANHWHKKGALCAARQGDNVNPNRESSGSQFYLVTGKVSSKAQIESMCSQVNAKEENVKIGEYLRKPENKAHMDAVVYCQQNRNQDSLIKVIEGIKPEALEGFERFEYSKEAIKDYETIGGTPFLDQNYTVFGEIVEGIEVLDAIGQVATQPGDRPVEDVKIISMKLK